MKLDILAFGAHPDDVEISAGATLLKYSQQGKKIGIIDLTLGELSTRGNVDLRKQEAQKASEFLRLSVRENLELKDGFFSENEDTLRLIISKIRQYQPTIIMANSLSDRHPDHGRAAQLLGNAAYYSGLIKIQTQVNGSKQMRWRPKIVLHYIQDFHREPDLLLDVTGFEKDKVELINCYSSQFFNANSSEPETPISGPNFMNAILGRMSVFGRSIGANYAEGFNVNRSFGVNDLFNLV